MFDDDPPKEKEPVDYTGLKLGAVLLPVFFLITFLSNADMALAAVIILAVIIFRDQTSLALEVASLVLGSLSAGCISDHRWFSRVVPPASRDNSSDRCLG